MREIIPDHFASLPPATQPIPGVAGGWPPTKAPSQPNRPKARRRSARSSPVARFRAPHL